jgi:hypothetical protein
MDSLSVQNQLSKEFRHVSALPFADGFCQRRSVAVLFAEQYIGVGAFAASGTELLVIESGLLESVN